MFLDFIRHQKLKNYKDARLEELDIKINKLYKMLQKYENDVAITQKRKMKDQVKEDPYIKQLNYQLSILARELMKVKWSMIDRGKETEVLQCRICDYKAHRDQFETKVAECQFNGGRLIRYICPQCGVIFGPSKFLELSETEISDDYAIHYVGFQEGDSTQKEIEAFQLLQPDKMKLYLNYGCGCWSKSLQFLRDEGYQVFGYEPHAFEENNPYMITNKESLKKIRFDGIYSNNVIEHLTYPVEEFEFMKSLLKSRHSKMSHSTPCYTYKYENTRFHAHFYTGNSINVLCHKAGLDIIERITKDGMGDFTCYLYSPQRVEMNYIDQLCGLTKTEIGYVLEPNKVMFGPYLTIGGSSQWILEIENISDRGG